MRYQAVATDYDGTLAADGRVAPSSLKALERVRESGRRTVLVTGRELDQLLEVFPEIEIFDRVVAENGALVYRPGSREVELLAGPPPEGFVEALRAAGVEPLSVGHSIVATWEPHEEAVLAAIRDLGLELQVIFNKGAVMVLPSGVNKATGLQEALRELGLSPHNVVGVGDAENDHAFLEVCECSVAVANALPSLRDRCDHVTEGARGDGVEELVERLLEDDLASLGPRLGRHRIVIGEREGRPVWMEPHGAHVLLAAPSGSGKSTLATAILERLGDAGYQFCLVDPEGDYESFAGAIVLGTSDRAPSIDEVLQILENPDDHVVVNLLGIPLADRPGYFDALVPATQRLRARSGRPHWLVIDEAHHLLPAARSPAGAPQDLPGALMITVHPEKVAREVLEGVDVLLTVGERPGETIRAFADALGEPVPSLDDEEPGAGAAVAWFRGAGRRPEAFEIAQPRMERRRHRRKYAEGELSEDRSFFFRGPEGRLNLRAQNLTIFVQLAEGVDDETWDHHRRLGDYSRWFREIIKDDELASATESVEQDDSRTPEESRAAVRALIEAAYTLPA